MSALKSNANKINVKYAVPAAHVVKGGLRNGDVAVRYDGITVFISIKNGEFDGCSSKSRRTSMHFCDVSRGDVADEYVSALISKAIALKNSLRFNLTSKQA